MVKVIDGFTAEERRLERRRWLCERDVTEDLDRKPRVLHAIPRKILNV